MSDPVRLLVPAEEAYRALASELARKYCETSGGSPTDGASLGASVTAAMAQVTAGAPPLAEIALTFTLEAGGVEIRLRCGDRAAGVTQPLPERKSS